MSSNWIALALGALLASRNANAACVIHGARPTAPLPTMVSGQEFTFIASPDCETLRFTIRGTELSMIPRSGGPVGPGPNTYKVALTESEWDAVVAESGSTLTWVVTGRTSAGETTPMVTTNDLNLDEPITFDLSMADAKLVGEHRLNYASSSASIPGDVNGDGNDDLFLDAPYNSEGGARAGAAYLVLGPVTGTLDLSRADAKLLGEEPGANVGYSTGAGDVDGDGNDDLLVGSWPGSTGAAYLLNGPVSGTLNLSLADAKLVVETDDDDEYGICRMSGAGDVDADGNDDFLVGTCSDADDAIAYLVHGPITGTSDLGLAADAELVLEPSFYDRAVVSAAGDVDSDGIDDVLIGAPYDDEAETSAGAAYLVRGPVSGVVDLPLGHTKLLGEPIYLGSAGGSVSGAGDIDGDGNDDVLITGLEGVSFVGVAYVVLGPGPEPGTWDLESVADAKLRAADASAVNFVSGAGDMDLDGHHDILVSTIRGAEVPNWTGTTYLVLSPVAGTMDLSQADVQFTGAHPDVRMDVVNPGGAGDVNGDGRSDLFISVPFNDDGGENAGAAYLIYGGSL